MEQAEFGSDTLQKGRTPTSPTQSALPFSGHLYKHGFKWSSEQTCITLISWKCSSERARAWTKVTWQLIGRDFYLSYIPC